MRKDANARNKDGEPKAQTIRPHHFGNKVTGLLPNAATTKRSPLVRLSFASCSHKNNIFFMKCFRTGGRRNLQATNIQHPKSREKSRVVANNRQAFGKNRQKKPVYSPLFAIIRFAWRGILRSELFVNHRWGGSNFLPCVRRRFGQVLFPRHGPADLRQTAFQILAPGVGHRQTGLFRGLFHLVEKLFWQSQWVSFHAHEGIIDDTRWFASLDKMRVLFPWRLHELYHRFFAAWFVGAHLLQFLAST